MSKASLKRKIEEIPPDWADGWRKGGDAVFLEHALRLVECGFTEEQVIDWLGELYYAVASEYGV